MLSPGLCSPDVWLAWLVPPLAPGLALLFASLPLADDTACSALAAAGELLAPPENAAADCGPRCTAAAFLAAVNAAARRDASSASR